MVRIDKEDGLVVSVPGIDPVAVGLDALGHVAGGSDNLDSVA